MAAPGSTPAAAPGTLILAIFTAIRLVLVLDLIPAALSESLASPALASALVNPLHTVHHLREGNFLLELAASAAGEGNGGGTFDQAYEGMVFHLPPLVLFLFRPTFALVASKDVQDAIIGVVFAVVDLGVALTLYDLACSILLDPTDASRREASLEAIMESRIRPMRAWVFGLVPREAGPRKEYIPAPIVEVRDLPRLCCLLYYCNPVSVLACCGTAVQSLHSLWYLAFLLSLREATKSAPNVPLATFFLSVVSYVELYPVVFLIPIALFIGRTRKSCIGTSVFGQAGIECLIWFALWSGALQALSALLVGDWIGVCSKTYGYVFGFSDLSPNMGMNWYFFIQMFDRFRRFYVVMLSLIPLVFVAPLTIRLRAYPAVLVAAFFLLGTLYKPVQTLHDASIGIVLLLLAPRTLARMGNAALVCICAIPVPASLYLMDYWLWLSTGSGNANYMFFQCLAYNAFLGICTLDFVSSSVKRDKALRLTEKVREKANAVAKAK